MQLTAVRYIGSDCWQQLAKHGYSHALAICLAKTAQAKLLAI